jgi:hypothetical protein
LTEREKEIGGMALHYAYGISMGRFMGRRLNFQMKLPSARDFLTERSSGLARTKALCLCSDFQNRPLNIRHRFTPFRLPRISFTA